VLPTKFARLYGQRSAQASTFHFANASPDDTLRTELSSRAIKSGMGRIVEVQTREISVVEADEVLKIRESHFSDLKSSRISPATLTKTISAFANASGGEIYVGIEEIFDGVENTRVWAGFSDEEAANPIFQVIAEIDPLGGSLNAQFLRADGFEGLILLISVFKSQSIMSSTTGKVYIRRNAQNLPVSDQALDQLKFDKGVKSFEDEIVNCDSEDIENSETIIEFLLDTVPTGEPRQWLEKQRVLVAGRPTVAGVLLFSDSPQALLPKRSAIKILRYQTKKEAERDFLASDPQTVEGPIYSLIYEAVDRAKATIEGIEKAGPSGMEKISYPEEALHEIVTNAVLHRDYSVAADVQIRIFDNRVEIESPGRLPGHVTVENIKRTQFARNPKIVRLINKFKNPPNKDVGEGINTAFEAMEKLRLKSPTFEEKEGSVVVTLRHESLASPEQIVMEFLKTAEEITNAIARDLTGIKSENSMKQVFYKLRESGQLEQTPKVLGKKPSWRKPSSN